MDALTWSTMPLLPLRCILEHLSTEDAMAAMSTCRHWHNAILLYEGRRDILKLRAKQLDQCIYLARLFRKHTRKLHVYLDCNEPEIDKFLKSVLVHFFDSMKLQELVFIGPSYIQQSNHLPFIKLKRVVIETLVFKHIHCIKKLSFMGCGLGPLKNENDRYSHKSLEYYARPLEFCSVQTPADAILSSANQRIMQTSSMTHVSVDYEQINTVALQTMSKLPHFRFLTLNITNKRVALRPIDWIGLHNYYRCPLRVTVNIIAVPYRKFENIMDNVLIEGLRLISLKVMFCKSLYTPMLSHVSRLFQTSLVEVLWADTPYESNDPYHRVVRPMRHPQPDTYAHVNPFVLLCWQCMHLQRLVIHGYWIWQYDVLGFVRLRKGLLHLEISAIYSKQDTFNSSIQLSEEGAVRVLCGDSPPPVDPDYVHEVNEYTDFKWKPVQWGRLHPGLRAGSSPQQRLDYILSEAKAPLGVTLY